MKIHVWTIDGNKMLMNRKGKVNKGTHVSMRSSVHKSKKDYNRKKLKQELRKEIYKFV